MGSRNVHSVGGVVLSQQKQETFQTQSLCMSIQWRLTFLLTSFMVLAWV